MLIAPLGSGSAGNSTLLESDGTSILVDAGFGPRETAKRLQAVGRSIESINAIVLTHEHHDHIRGAARIAQKLGIPLFLTAGTLAAGGIDGADTPVVVFENDSSFRIGELMLHARKTLHDAADPACFVIEGCDGTRVGLATDLGHVDDDVLEHLRGCDALLFESNHDLDMLRTGSYPWSLKRRIMSRFGHLSNDDSMLALRSLVGDELKHVCMIHLSTKNNHESIVRSMARSTIASTGAAVEIHIARQDRPLPMIEAFRRTVMPGPSHAQLRLF